MWLYPAEYVGTLLGAAFTAWLFTFIGAPFLPALTIMLGLNTVVQALIARVKPSRRPLAVLVALTFAFVLGIVLGVIRIAGV